MSRERGGGRGERGGSVAAGPPPEGQARGGGRPPRPSAGPGLWPHLNVSASARRSEAAEREGGAAGRREGGWRCSQLERWVGISGPYDMVGLEPILHKVL